MHGALLEAWRLDCNHHRPHSRIAYNRSRKPWQNGAAESLVAIYQREVLDAELFHSLLEAHVIRERWRRFYKGRRPHSRLG